MQEGLEPILDCYLHETNDSDTTISVDFIDTSFRDYLISEYYIESILEGKLHYLGQGIPTKEVMEFLDGLLELFNNTDKKDKEIDAEILRSLSLHNESSDHLSINDIRARLLENSWKFYKNEQVILHADTQSSYLDKIWHVSKFPYLRYAELSIHRWISLYIINKLDPQKEFDIKTLEILIKSTSHNIPSHLKKLAKIDLSGADLSKANLSGADLSEAKLFGADISSTEKIGESYFLKANLSGADLSGADLSEANLSDADLSETDLTNARFLHAIVSRANLSGANLSGAHFEGANINDVLRFYI